MKDLSLISGEQNVNEKKSKNYPFPPPGAFFFSVKIPFRLLPNHSLSLLLIGDDSIDALALQVLRVIRLVVLIAPAEESQTCVLHL